MDGLDELLGPRFISVRFCSSSWFHSQIYSNKIKLIDVLDGAMIVLAIYTLNFVHPGVFLAEEPSSESKTSAA